MMLSKSILSNRSLILILSDFLIWSHKFSKHSLKALNISLNFLSIYICKKLSKLKQIEEKLVESVIFSVPLLKWPVLIIKNGYDFRMFEVHNSKGFLFFNSLGKNSQIISL